MVSKLVIVGAMLIGYIAIIALLNGLVSGAFSLLSGGAIKWDFQTLIGFVCTISILSWCTLGRRC